MIAIDLFAGAGGLSLGLELAGFDVVCAVENDPIATATHQKNFPRCKVVTSDIQDVSGNHIREVAGLQPDVTVDLVAGGAPCQGFSTMGKRDVEDPRNQLIWEFCRIVDELKPNYFLFENVKGLTMGQQKNFLVDFISKMDFYGYEVVKPLQVLNARDYGVPQSRERLFIYGVKKGLPLPSYPEKQAEGVTCFHALCDLPVIENYPELLQFPNWKIDKDISTVTSDYAELMKSDLWGYERQCDRSFLYNTQATRHSEAVKERFANCEPGKKEKISRFYKLSEYGQSNTLRAGTGSNKGSHTSARPVHYKYPRCVTVREMARLQSFPDWFEFNPTVWHGARQIGNSVPPLLAKAVAIKIQQTILRVD